MAGYNDQGKSSKSALLARLGHKNGGKITPEKAVDMHEARLHKGARKTFATGGGIEAIDGAGPLERLDKPKRKKSKSDINVVINLGKPSDMAPPVPPLPAPAAPPPATPPMGGAPMGSAPMGGAPNVRPPMPPAAPMLGRKAGGRVHRADGGRSPIKGTPTDSGKRSNGGNPLGGDYTHGLEEDTGTSNTLKKGAGDALAGDRTKPYKKGGRAKCRADGGAAQQDIMDKASEGTAKAYEAMDSDQRKKYTDEMKADYGLKRGGRAWGGRSNYPDGHPQGKVIPRIDPSEMSNSELRDYLNSRPKARLNPGLGEVEEIRACGGKVSKKPARKGKKFGGDANAVLSALPAGITLAEKLMGKAAGGKVAPNGKAGTDSGVGRMNQAEYYGRKG